VSTGKLSVLAYPHVEVQPGLNVAGWTARGGWVKAHPEATVKFRRVLQKTMDFLNQNPQEKTAAILKFTTLKPDLLSRITLDQWTTKIDSDDLQKQLELYKRQGMIDKTFDVKEMVLQ
jgi:NitT/TauT family transport system substrate-binding protein